MSRKRTNPRETLTRLKKKTIAEGLIYRHFLEGKKLVDAYLELHPRSKANEKNRAKMAKEIVDWYRVEYPLGTEMIMHLKHMGTAEAIDKLKELTEATERVKVGVVRTPTGDGSYVDEYQFEDHPALRIRLDALKLWMQVLGLIAGGRKGVVPPGDAPRNATGTANGHGPPPCRIHGAEPMTHDEWMEEWEQLQEDRRRRRRDHLN